jgi:hypothetical protein
VVVSTEISVPRKMNGIRKRARKGRGNRNVGGTKERSRNADFVTTRRGKGSFIKVATLIYFSANDALKIQRRVIGTDKGPPVDGRLGLFPPFASSSNPVSGRRNVPPRWHLFALFQSLDDAVVSRDGTSGVRLSFECSRLRESTANCRARALFPACYRSASRRIFQSSEFAIW